GNHPRRRTDQRSPREFHRQPGKGQGGGRGRADRAGPADGARANRDRAEARSAAGRRFRAAAAVRAAAASPEAPAAGHGSAGGRDAGSDEVLPSGATMTFKALQMAQVRRATAEQDRAAWRSVLDAALRTLAAAALSAALSLGAWQAWRWAATSDMFAVRAIRFTALVRAREAWLEHQPELQLRLFAALHLLDTWQASGFPIAAVSEVRLDEGGGFTLFAHDGTGLQEVRLGSSDIALKLRRLAQVRGVLARRGERAARIDLDNPARPDQAAATLADKR